MTAPAASHDESETTLKALQLVRDKILSDSRLVEAQFRGARRGDPPPWVRVTIRPVLIRDERQLQFSYFDGRQDMSANYVEPESTRAVEELLAQSYSSIIVQLTDHTLRVQFSKKGRAIVHREDRLDAIPLDMAHDRAKALILTEEQPIPFLQELGIMTADGRVRADQRRKFRQINEFLRLLDESGQMESFAGGPVRVADLGCGNAALTFATYYYLTAIRGLTAEIAGVDVKAHLIAKHQATAERLNWDGLTFAVGRIADYAPEVPPDIVLALHACDTATDEALAQGVRWQSRLILNAPCCHHHLQAQLAKADPPDAFAAVLRHGILKERLGDILTDSFRAQILQLLGYRTDVIEFIAVEHTPKNLMIRAIHEPGRVASAATIRHYQALRDYWHVKPYLADLLASELEDALRPPDES